MLTLSQKWSSALSNGTKMPPELSHSSRLSLESQVSLEATRKNVMGLVCGMKQQLSDLLSDSTTRG